MKIVQPGKLEFVDTVFTGTCEVCGCVFECIIGVAHGKNFSKFYRNKEEMPGFEFTPGGLLTCFCPECDRSHVLLKEKE